MRAPGRGGEVEFAGVGGVADLVDFLGEEGFDFGGGEGGTREFSAGSGWGGGR